MNIEAPWPSGSVAQWLSPGFYWLLLLLYAVPCALLVRQLYY